MDGVVGEAQEQAVSYRVQGAVCSYSFSVAKAAASRFLWQSFCCAVLQRWRAHKPPIISGQSQELCHVVAVIGQTVQFGWLRFLLCDRVGGWIGKESCVLCQWWFLPSGLTSHLRDGLWEKQPACPAAGNTWRSFVWFSSLLRTCVGAPYTWQEVQVLWQLLLGAQRWVEVLVMASHELLGVMTLALSHFSWLAGEVWAGESSGFWVGFVLCMSPQMPPQLCLAHLGIHCFYVVKYLILSRS